MIIDDIDKRKPNMFEKVLLFLGIGSVGVGYFFVHKVALSYGLYSSQTTNALLLWMVMLILVILTAVSENSKEELKIIINQQSEELKLLRSDMRRKR